MRLAWIISLGAAVLAVVATLLSVLAAAALGAGLGSLSLTTVLIQSALAAGVGVGAGWAASWFAEGQLRRLRAVVSVADVTEAPAAPLVSSLASIARLHLEVVEQISDDRRIARSQVRQIEIRKHLAETEVEHLSGVLHSLRDAVLVTNEFHELIMANEAAAVLFNFDRESAMNKPISQVMPEKEILAMIGEAAEAGSISSRKRTECVLPRDPEPLNLEISLSSLANAAHEAASVVTILHDITQERQVSRMKNEFVSKASLELRTPLSSIKAYIEMLLDGEARDEKARREFYEIIQLEAERLGRMIDNMLNISRIEAGMITATWETVDMVPIAAEAVDLLKPQAAEKKISIQLQKPHQACYVDVDKDMMKQVITNLISNAIKYTPEGGHVTVAPDLTDCDRSVIVSITDSGLGIPPEALPKLFSKFYRVQTHERVAKGTGLGLNLVKQIVEAVHHGEVGVESEVGKGSRFWFIVPCKQGA